MWSKGSPKGAKGSQVVKQAQRTPSFCRFNASIMASVRAKMHGKMCERFPPVPASEGNGSVERPSEESLDVDRSSEDSFPTEPRNQGVYGNQVERMREPMYQDIADELDLLSECDDSSQYSSSSKRGGVRRLSRTGRGVDRLSDRLSGNRADRRKPASSRSSSKSASSSHQWTATPTPMSQDQPKDPIGASSRASSPDSRCDDARTTGRFTGDMEAVDCRVLSDQVVIVGGPVNILRNYTRGHTLSNCTVATPGHGAPDWRPTPPTSPKGKGRCDRESSSKDHEQQDELMLTELQPSMFDFPNPPVRVKPGLNMPKTKAVAQLEECGGSKFRTPQRKFGVPVAPEGQGESLSGSQETTEVAEGQGQFRGMTTRSSESEEPWQGPSNASSSQSYNVDVSQVHAPKLPSTGQQFVRKRR